MFCAEWLLMVGVGTMETGKVAGTMSRSSSSDLDHSHTLISSQALKWETVLLNTSIVMQTIVNAFVCHSVMKDEQVCKLLKINQLMFYMVNCFAKCEKKVISVPKIFKNKILGHLAEKKKLWNYRSYIEKSNIMLHCLFQFCHIYYQFINAVLKNLELYTREIFKHTFNYRKMDKMNGFNIKPLAFWFKKK